MIEIYLLQQLDAFARLGTLSRAARELHITQPALTRSMKKLEEMAGMELFNRYGNKLSLNETGKVAARYARRILEDEDEMEEQMTIVNRSLKSIVLDSCGPMPILRLSPLLQMKFPGKSIVTEIEESDAAMISKLKDRTIQLAVLHAEPNTPGIYSQKYVHEALYVYVPKDHPLAGQKSVTPKELSSYKLLVHRHIGFWMAICRKKFPLRNMLMQDSLGAIDALARSSSMAMFTTDAMMKLGYVTKDRVAIPIDDPEMHVLYYAACLDSEKDRFRSFFNAVHSEALEDTQA